MVTWNKYTAWYCHGDFKYTILRYLIWKYHQMLNKIGEILNRLWCLLIKSETRFICQFIWRCGSPTRMKIINRNICRLRPLLCCWNVLPWWHERLGNITGRRISSTFRHVVNIQDITTKGALKSAPNWNIFPESNSVVQLYEK